MDLLSEKYSKHLEALGNSDRIKILELLAGGEMCVQEINKHFYASQATVSYHLLLLKSVGFIKARKEGKFTYYSLENSNIKSYLKAFVRDFSFSLKNA